MKPLLLLRNTAVNSELDVYGMCYAVARPMAAESLKQHSVVIAVPKHATMYHYATLEAQAYTAQSTAQYSTQWTVCACCALCCGSTDGFIVIAEPRACYEALERDTQHNTTQHNAMQQIQHSTMTKNVPCAAAVDAPALAAVVLLTSRLHPCSAGLVTVSV
jgi:hypothetical protein